LALQVSINEYKIAAAFAPLRLPENIQFFASQSNRKRNILEIKCHGHMEWQKRRDYGKRNYSELAIQRYKRILGNKLHARDFERQKQEAIIGCSILNKMMCLTLGEIRSNF